MSIVEETIEPNNPWFEQTGGRSFSTKLITIKQLCYNVTVNDLKPKPNRYSHPGKAGRKPKPSTLVSRALLEVDKRLPDIFKALIDKAIEGDREAQIYLIDRRLGKPKVVTEIEADEGLSKVAFIIAMKAIIGAEQKYLTEGGNDALQGQINEVPTPKREEER